MAQTLLRDYRALWEAWNAGGGPRYPSEKVVQFTYRNFPAAIRSTVRTLDLGCGSGANTWFLAREGFPVVGSDLTSHGLANTRNRLLAEGLSAELVQADATHLPFRNASFEYVICVRVLELIPNTELQDRLIGECARVLRSSGRGLALFASPKDYGSQYPEKGFGPFFPPDEQQVERLFRSRFSKVDIDVYQTTYESGRLMEHNYLVTFVK